VPNSGPYCGLALTEMEERNLRIPKSICMAGWMGSTLMALSLIYGPFAARWLSMDTIGCSVVGAIYAGSCRTLWGLSICWLIFACGNNSGCWFDVFLLHPIFRALSPITYAMLLFNTLADIFTARHPIYFDEFGMVW